MDVYTQAILALKAQSAVSDLPPTVAALAATLEALTYAEAPEPFFNADSATAENVTELVNKLAAEIAVGGDAHAEAVRIAKYSISRNILAACGEAVPTIKADLQKAVTKAGKVFSENLTKLPADKSPASVLRTPNGSELYAQVLSAQEMLLSARQWATGLTSLPVYSLGVSDPVLAIVDVQDRSQWQTLLDAKVTEDSDIDPILATAVELGLAFVISDPVEQAAMSAKFNDEPAVYKGFGHTKLVENPNGGVSLVRSDGSDLAGN